MKACNCKTLPNTWFIESVIPPGAKTKQSEEWFMSWCVYQLDCSRKIKWYFEITARMELLQVSSGLGFENAQKIQNEKVMFYPRKAYTVSLQQVIQIVVLNNINSECFWQGVVHGNEFEWQIKTLFIAHRGALQQACQRVSCRAVPLPDWKYSVERISWNETESPLPLNSRKCTRGIVSTVSGLNCWKAVLKMYRKVTKQSKLDKIKTSSRPMKGRITIQYEYYFSFYNYLIYSILRPWNVLTFVAEEPQSWGETAKDSRGVLKMVWPWRP